VTLFPYTTLFRSIEANIHSTGSTHDDPVKRFDHIREFYSLLGRASGNQVLELLIDATTSISLDFARKYKIEWTPELIPLQQNVLGRLRARDAEGATRAIGENIAFLHGFVIARAMDRAPNAPRAATPALSEPK
jgi:DNA-binding GntR family transcriptional regulator